MTCEFERLLSPYYDRELSERRLQEVKVHLETCSACSRRLAALAVASRSFAALDPASVASSPRAERAAPAGRRAMALVAAALAVVAVGAALILSHPGGSGGLVGPDVESATESSEPSAFSCDWRNDPECLLVTPCLSIDECGPGQAFTTSAPIELFDG